MRILKLHHPTGHPYWQKNEFKVELPNGKFFDLEPLFYNDNHGGYEIFVENGNIYFVQCGSGQGYGKVRCNDVKMIVDRKEYDLIEYVGNELIVSDTLKEDIREFLNLEA